jgi:DNA-binding response OmpR family regulator
MFDRGQYSVLVVDDNEASRYAISRGLRACGFTTVEAGSGAEALRLSEAVAAIVLDVHLPDLHGMEVCRIIRGRASTAELPIVHISALFTSETDRWQGTRAGGDDYMTAPVDPYALADKLDALLTDRQRIRSFRPRD